MSKHEDVCGENKRDSNSNGNWTLDATSFLEFEFKSIDELHSIDVGKSDFNHLVGFVTEWFGWYHSIDIGKSEPTQILEFDV